MTKKVSPAKLGNRKNFFMTITYMCFTTSTAVNWIKYKDIKFFIAFAVLGTISFLISMYYKNRLKRLA